jgi:peptidoglycan/xylan/chitin deacetylase (PgdA/CDA1 family)
VRRSGRVTTTGPLPPTRVVFWHIVGPLIEDGLSGEPSDGDAMITPVAHLEAHLALLQAWGYRFATAGELAELWSGKSPPPGIAVLTFDDGWRDGLTTVAPLLARLGLPATFFVSPVGFGKRFPRFGDAAIMTATEARALHDAGMELASHSFSHPDLRALSDAELRRELVSSREAVEALTGEPCLTLAYPSGWHDRRVQRAAAAAGYKLAFTARSGRWRKFTVPRVQAPTIGAPETLIRRLDLPPASALRSAPVGSRSEV